MEERRFKRRANSRPGVIPSAAVGFASRTQLRSRGGLLIPCVGFLAAYSPRPSGVCK